MEKKFLIVAFVAFYIGGNLFAQGEKQTTFCNPLNIDYQPYEKRARTAADPVIVPFKGKYYLFCSLYNGGILGYRISDDLVSWRLVKFDDKILEQILNPKTGEAFAPGLVSDGEYVYCAYLGGRVAIRSNNPEDPSSWEIFSQKAFAGFDPAYFLDGDGKLYNYSGALESNVVELERKDFSEIGGTKKQLTPKTKTPEVLINSAYGLYQGKQEYESRFSDWNKVETLDTARIIPRNPPAKPQLNTVSTDSMQEAAWMTKYKGKYYLQNSNPGTACPWYSDSVWVSDSPTGPFEMPDYATAAMKVGGFANGAGHSCVFEDFNGNLWRITTMWIGVYAGFERRIGLFPAGFDKQGRMFTQTEFGDYPIIMPKDKRKEGGSLLAGWNVLGKSAKCEASSVFAHFKIENAADENIRTWWSAKSGDAGEWFSMDLGKVCSINSIQINFAEQDIDQSAVDEDYNSYKLYVSNNGNDWKLIVDKSENKAAVPHDYISFEKNIKARHVKIENVHMPKKGKFALRDLRVFGNAGGVKPYAVTQASAVRDENDLRNMTFYWKPIKDAQGYIIHYGVAPDALHLSLQYQKPEAEKLTVSCFNRDAKDYYFRVDSYNENGVSEGKIFKAGLGKLELGEPQAAP